MKWINKRPEIFGNGSEDTETYRSEAVGIEIQKLIKRRHSKHPILNPINEPDCSLRVL